MVEYNLSIELDMRVDERVILKAFASQNKTAHLISSAATDEFPTFTICNQNKGFYKLKPNTGMFLETSSSLDIPA